jgi:hypothetical protein
LISHISLKTSEIWGTHSCGWVRVLRAVHSSLNLPSAKSFARDKFCCRGQAVFRASLRLVERGGVLATVAPCTYDSRSVISCAHRVGFGSTGTAYGGVALTYLISKASHLRFDSVRSCSLSSTTAGQGRAFSLTRLPEDSRETSSSPVTSGDMWAQTVVIGGPRHSRGPEVSVIRRCQ